MGSRWFSMLRRNRPGKVRETRRVLILGAGRVSGPIVRYLLEQQNCRLLVASLIHKDARALIGDHPRGTAMAVDVTRDDEVEPLVRDAHIVISLVPYDYHVPVAKLAIQHRVPMVTTSYVSPAMQALDDDAKQAGVLLLNETGLDPGLDHMSAMRFIDRVQRSGQRVTALSSCCGGLPAPEAANNPWRYKFSWSPQGALMAGRQAARYLRDGRVYHIPGDRLFAHCWNYDLGDLGPFEVYANRDALRYVRLYGLAGIRNMFRGTLRYPGWCESMKALAELGLVDLQPREWPPETTYGEFLASFLPPGDEGPLAERLARRLGVSPGHRVIRRLEWVGLLSDEPIPEDAQSPIGVVSRRFQEMMGYAPGERDMVVLEHVFEVAAHGRPAERIHSLLAVYGEPGGDSATARTVSLPAAIAARLILDGQLTLTGVHVPILPQIYGPILDELATHGIAFEERSAPSPASVAARGDDP